MGETITINTPDQFAALIAHVQGDGIKVHVFACHAGFIHGYEHAACLPGAARQRVRNVPPISAHGGNQHGIAKDAHRANKKAQRHGDALRPAKQKGYDSQRQQRRHGQADS